MRNCRLQIITFIMGFFAVSSAWAGGCKFETVSTAKMRASDHMASQVRNQVLEIERRMNAQGQELKAVMIARAGQLLGGFDIIKDKPSEPYIDYVQKLARFSVAHKEGRLSFENEDGEREAYEPSQSSILPDHYYQDDKMVFTHIGFLLKRNPSDPENVTDPDWFSVVHLLAECDKEKMRYGESEIFFESFNKFYWDSKALESHKKKYRNARKTLLAIPTPAIQENIYRLTQNSEFAENQIHERTYNAASVPFLMLSHSDKKANERIEEQNRKKAEKNVTRVAQGKEPKALKPLKHQDPGPYQLKDQNSNQWPLEILAAATRPYGEIQNRQQAQQLLLETNYRPTLAKPASMKTKASCTFKKGPFGIWDASNILNCEDQVFRPQHITQLITVKSVMEYMKRNNFLADNVLEPGTPAIFEFEADQKMLETLKLGAETADRMSCEANLKSEKCDSLSKNERERIQRSQSRRRR